MKIIELTKEQEEKWLSDIKEDRIEFIHRLYHNLESKDINFKLKLSNNLIKELFFECHEIFDDNNEYKIRYYELITEDSIKTDDLRYIFSMLYLNDFKLNNINLSQRYLDIIKGSNIILDLDNVYGDVLSCLIIENLTIKGSFDNFKIYRTKIINNKNLSQERIKINPQKFINRDLSFCTIKGAEFTDNFDNCNIKEITLEDNINTIMNPQKVANKDLSNATIKDAKFIESLDGCEIYRIKLDNVENAHLHIGCFADVCSQSFDNIKIYITNDDELNIFEKVFDPFNGNSCSGSTIVCSLKYKDLINRFLLDRYGEIRFEILESYFDNDIVSIFDNIPKSIVNEDNNIKQTNNSIKQKKKSIFDRFRK